MYLAVLLLALFPHLAQSTAATAVRPVDSDFYLVCSHAGYNVGCDALRQCKSCPMECKKAEPSLPLPEECSLIIDTVTIASRDGTPKVMLKPPLPLSSAELMPQTDARAEADPRALFLRTNARGKPPLVHYYAYEIKNSIPTLQRTTLTCVDAPSGLISAMEGPGFSCYFRNDFFETSVPVIYSFEKHEFVLLYDSTAQFSVRPMSAPDMNGSPAQPLHRVSPVAPAAASIQLCASHDASGSCEKVDVPANAEVKLLGSWAPLQTNDAKRRTPAQMHVKLDLSNAWLHVDVNGSRGWIHGDKDFRAIGLPVPVPQSATPPAPPQNQPLN